MSCPAVFIGPLDVHTAARLKEIKSLKKFSLSLSSNLQSWNGYISQTVHCLKIPLQNKGFKSKCDRTNKRN
jgi:hypothetical protein